MGPVILFFLFFLVFRGFGYWDMGSVILFFFVFLCFSRFLIPLSRENKVICIARDGCTSDTGMYSSAVGCIYGLCWPENSEKSALPRCPVLFFFVCVLVLDPGVLFSSIFHCRRNKLSKIGSFCSQETHL